MFDLTSVYLIYMYNINNISFSTNGMHNTVIPLLTDIVVIYPATTVYIPIAPIWRYSV